MTDMPELTIQRDLDDIKLQVKKELATIREMMDTVGYRRPSSNWSTPYQMHRLRRALRIHYLALKIRDSNHVSDTVRDLTWEPLVDFD